MENNPTLFTIAWDAWRAERGGASALALRQRRRLCDLVDETYQPVPAGQPSYTVLLTNLANRVQPVIRYDLGDSISMRPDPCPCGSPLPALRVAGRRSAILQMQAPSGARIAILPLALSTVIEEVPGVHRFQVIQTAPATLHLRLEVVPGAEPSQVWDTLASHL